MKKFSIALIVLAFCASIDFPGFITCATAPAAALPSSASIVKNIVSRHLKLLGTIVQLAAENGEDDNGSDGKEEEAGGNPLEGGIERIWNAAQLA